MKFKIENSVRFLTRTYIFPHYSASSTLVLIWSKRKRLNHLSFLKSVLIFSNVFQAQKTLSKFTALLLIKTPHKPSSPILP